MVLPFSIALIGELDWKFPTDIPLGTPKVATLAEKTPRKMREAKEPIVRHSFPQMH